MVVISSSKEWVPACGGVKHLVVIDVQAADELAKEGISVEVSAAVELVNVMQTQEEILTES